MSKDLVKVVKDTGGSLSLLNDLRKELKEIPTPKLVTGYLMAKDYSNMVKKFVEAVREELLFETKESAEEKCYDGRFFDDGVEVDEKGHRWITGEDGKVLKAEKRVSNLLDEEKAEEYLKRERVWEQATNESVVVIDDTVVSDLMQLRLQIVNGDESSWKYLAKLDEAIGKLEVRRKIDEKKVEALVVLGQISMDVLEQFYEESVVYALKAGPKKK